MSNRVEHYLTVGDTPFCRWLGCEAGRGIATQANVHTCGFESGASAKRAAQRLQPFFCAPVKLVRGLCPSLTGG